MSDLTLSSEQSLIDRACKGSVDAFEKLVLLYQDRLYRFLLIRAGNKADAEDALQDAFVAAFRYLPSYRREYSFSTWLFTIALRQLGALRKKCLPQTEDLIESVVCAQPGPEQLGMQRQRNETLWQTARRCLNEFQFLALWLFYVEEMSLADIASTMQRPSSWVKVNLMRARRRLSAELEHSSFSTNTPAREVTL